MPDEGRPNMPLTDEQRRTCHYVNMSLDAITAMDPSEAVSGHLLMSAIDNMFTLNYFREAGGALIMNMGGHFPFEDTNTDPACATWLRIMADIEKALYQQRIVPSDLVFFIASPRACSGPG